jgi:hypothetical protein
MHSIFTLGRHSLGKIKVWYWVWTPYSVISRLAWDIQVGDSPVGGLSGTSWNLAWIRELMVFICRFQHLCDEQTIVLCPSVFWVEHIDFLMKWHVRVTMGFTGIVLSVDFNICVMNRLLCCALVCFESSILISWWKCRLDCVSRHLHIWISLFIYKCIPLNHIICNLDAQPLLEVIVNVGPYLLLQKSIACVIFDIISMILRLFGILCTTKISLLIEMCITPHHD